MTLIIIIIILIVKKLVSPKFICEKMKIGNNQKFYTSIIASYTIILLLANIVNNNISSYLANPTIILMQSLLYSTKV